MLAAGAVVTDPQDRVLLVGRHRYGDLTLPKGKLKRDEPAPVAAVREVLEETGATIRLGPPLPESRYRTGQRDKVVRWWRGHLVDLQHREPDDEIDEVVWLPARQAAQRLTHDADRAVLDAALATPVTTPLLVVRHANAVGRRDFRKAHRWAPPDALRPLSRLGRREAEALTPLLAAFGITRLSSSTAQRCLATVRPYGRRGIPLDWYPVLDEGAATPKDIAGVMARLLDRVAAGAPEVICGHRPVLPAMLSPLDRAGVRLAKGELLAVHVTATGAAYLDERHRPLRRS